MTATEVIVSRRLSPASHPGVAVDSLELGLLDASVVEVGHTGIVVNSVMVTSVEDASVDEFDGD